MKLKECSKCHLIRPLSEYNKNAGNVDGHFGYCRVCNKIKAKEYRKTHKHVTSKHMKFWEKKFLDSWRGFIPTKANCECCGKEVYFASSDKTKSLHFDHRHGGNEAIKSPGHWLRKKPFNDKNKAIWESCDFGILCAWCNQRMPTKNREAFLKNFIRYFYGTNKTIHASEGTASIVSEG